MIVVDACIITAALTGHSSREEIAEALRQDPDLAAPAHLDVEVLSALRGRLLGKHLTMGHLRTAASKLATLPVRRVPLEDPELLTETVRWFHNLSAYDAAYLALTKTMKSTLVTGDHGLAAAAQRAQLACLHIDCSK